MTSSPAFAGDKVAGTEWSQYKVAGTDSDHTVGTVGPQGGPPPGPSHRLIITVPPAPPRSHSWSNTSKKSARIPNPYRVAIPH